MNLILLRHGQTDNNFTLKYNEDHNPLNDTGRLQIEGAADKIHQMDIDQALVSPLLRTKETFEIINRIHQIPHREMDLIREIDAGKIKGKTYDEAKKLYPDELEAQMALPLDRAFPGGESVRDVYKRAGDFLDHVRDLDSNVLAVTHKGFITIVLARVLGDIKLHHKFNVDNGSFTMIRLKPYTSIEYINRV